MFLWRPNPYFRSTAIGGSTVSAWLAALATLAAVITTGCVDSRTSQAPSPSGPPEALIDKVWRGKEIGGESVSATAQPTLRFSADGRAAGSGGCNAYNGPVNVDGEAMNFGQLASTRKACLPALLDQEQKFLIALAGTRSYTMQGERLTLLDAAGRPLVQLVRSE